MVLAPSVWSLEQLRAGAADTISRKSEDAASAIDYALRLQGFGSSPGSKMAGSTIPKPSYTATSTEARDADLAMLNSALAYTPPTQSPTPAPKPSSTTSAKSSKSSSSGSGGSSGGSSGGGGTSTPQNLRVQLQAELSGLEAERARERAALEEQFVLAPTQQEKDALARALHDIDQRYDEGRAMVTAAYDRASANLSGRIDDTRDRRESDMSALIEALEASAARTGELQSVMEGRDAGYGVGATLGGTSGGDAYAAEIADLAQIEGALSGQLNDISAEDQEFLLNLMDLEAPAQQATLRRSAEDRSSLAQRESDQRVQARIAQDQQLMQQLLADLDARFMQREDSLESRLMEEDMFSRQLAQERELSMAQIAASRAASRASAAKKEAPPDPQLERQLQYQMLAELDPADQKALIALGGFDPQVVSLIQGNMPYELSPDQWQSAQAAEAIDRKLMESYADRYGG